MQRILVMILSTVLIVVGAAWASDLHIEATCDEHAKFETTSDDDTVPDRSEHCGHCCHGNAHSIALPLAESKVMALPGASVSLPTDSLVSSLPLAPPTHPPQV